MKAKNILMTLLLAVGAIAAKANGFPPELALVSQPVMVYNYNSITVYYDVENIGDYTYRGDICIYLDPDDGYSYAEEYVKVRPGRIKRIAVEIPSYRIDRHFTYTIMPYYSIGRELYSFTTFEYFEPIRFCWHGTRTEPWVVITVGPRIRYYHRPGVYRYYYDGFRPPMPPPGHAMHPMDPMHHTYGYHYNNGGYPATHNWNSDEPKPNSGSSANSSATVRPNDSGASSGSTSGSMSSGNANTGNNSGTTGSVSNGSSKPTAPAAPRNDSGSVSRPSNSRPSTGTSSSGRTGNSGSSRVNNNSNSSRPSSGTSNSGRTGNSNVNRSSSNTRSSGTTNSGSSRASSSSSSTRSSGTSSSSSSSSSSSNSSSSRSGAGTRGR